MTLRQRKILEDFVMDKERFENRSETVVKNFAASKYARYAGYVALAVVALALLKWIF